MNKKITVLATLCLVFLKQPLLMAETTKIQPLSGPAVKAFISRLNEQGIIFRGTHVPEGQEPVTKDEVFGYGKDGSFGMVDTGMGWYLYKVDINNDKKDEYVLAMFGGSASVLSVEAIYQARNGKLVDIYNQIEMSMDKFIRETEKAPPDPEVRYTLFMNGTLTIEKNDNKIYFTLEKVERRYDTAKGGKFEDDFNPSEGYKFLWENGTIKLREYYEGR